jgi:hypothetical protein
VIATDCGFNAIWQEELSNSVTIPVFTSSLFLVPLISLMIGENKKVGIITADKTSLTDRHLRAAGIGESIPLCIVGMETKEEIFRVITGSKRTLNRRKFKSEVAEVSSWLLEQNSNVGAILLECTDLSPFIADIRRVANLPVFDIVMFVELLHRALC